MPKEAYAFRLRYTRSPRNNVNCHESELSLPTVESGHQIVLKAREHGVTIEKSKSLVLQGAEWATPEDAEKLGRFYADILARACARLRLGADFGDRAATSWFTEAGLETLSQQAGKTVLNDVHGLMVYERSGRPNLVFASMAARGERGVSLEQFLSVFASALSRPRDLTDKERASLLLFNSSFFPDSPDSRFMLLIMATEALIEQRPQSDNIQKMIRGFITAVGMDAELEPDEKIALKNGLGNLRTESVRQAGRRLVRERLGARSYKGMPANEFFEYCYGLRSTLAHGNLPLPTRDEVSGAAAQLEVMLSDLLSGDLLDVGPK